MATRAPRGPATPKATRTPQVLAAYVLHRYDWSETSVVLDLFTREQGRVAVVAKGAKRPYSQLRSVLLPFQRIQVALGRPPKSEDGAEAAGEVLNLRGAEWAGGSGTMPVGAALFSGFYLNELLMKLLARHDPHPALFDLYAETLATLTPAQEVDHPAALRAFELGLMQTLGVLPDLSVTTSTQELVDPARHYALLPESGVVERGVRGAPRPDGALTGEALIGLQAALLHGSAAALQQACARALPELRGVMRQLLHYHLGSSQLRTRQVMLDVQSL
jgi:DNA repair protein RecO (recombination protein O)